MAAVRTSQDSSGLPITSRQSPRHDKGSGIVIIGSCRGHAFVATEVLICADTLDAEDAIRAWLTEHQIYVTISNGEPASMGNASARDTES